MNQVFVTGMGAVSSLGLGVEPFFNGLRENQTGIRKIPEWAVYKGLHTLLGAPVPAYDVSSIPRTTRRTMSRMSELAVIAVQEALAQAHLKIGAHQYSPRIALCLGSTAGSPENLEAHFKKMIERGGPEGQLGTTFFKVMNHSVASNVAAALDFFGPIVGASSACSTSAQNMTLGWELLQTGLYDIIIAGGSDELHYTGASVFDTVLAASRGYNDRPEIASRPFDAKRDGLVVSEGAGIVVLETADSIRKRSESLSGVTIPKLAEFKGGMYTCDGTHMSQTQADSMAETMLASLERARVRPEEIDYVSAHATATLIGDQEEARAIGRALGPSTPVSSLKGHLGHSLAACGALEAIAAIKMIQQQVLIPTRNLDEIDPQCAGITHIQKLRSAPVKTILSNNFAFGGINSSLILSRVND
jgi:3-oxoacyl-[acyl-carrier-protein] synthase II